MKKYALRKSDIQAGDPRDPNFKAIYLDCLPVKHCFAFDLDAGRVGTYDARGDGVIRSNEDQTGAEMKWLTGNLVIEDKEGNRWI